MNKKFFLLGLFILLIISVCPIPFDLGVNAFRLWYYPMPILDDGLNSSSEHFLDLIRALSGFLSGLNIQFYVVILVGMIFYFKKYSGSSDNILTSFIVIYIFLLIFTTKGYEMMMLVNPVNTRTVIIVIITLILTLILTILSIILVHNSYGISYKIPIIVSTLAVFITQSITLIGLYLFQIKTSELNNYNSYNNFIDFNEAYLNFENFFTVIGILSFIAVTIMKIFFILAIINKFLTRDEKNKEILKDY